jgi:hypothetical protein
MDCGIGVGRHAVLRLRSRPRKPLLACAPAPEKHLSRSAGGPAAGTILLALSGSARLVASLQRRTLAFLCAGLLGRLCHRLRPRLAAPLAPAVERCSSLGARRPDSASRGAS